MSNDEHDIKGDQPVDFDPARCSGLCSICGEWNGDLRKYGQRRYCFDCAIKCWRVLQAESPWPGKAVQLTQEAEIDGRAYRGVLVHREALLDVKKALLADGWELLEVHGQGIIHEGKRKPASIAFLWFVRAE